MLAALFSLALAYPAWPTRATWRGTLTYPALGRQEGVTWFYDAALPAWRQDIASLPANLTYLVLAGKFYAVRGGANCTAKDAVAPDYFAFSPRQFENFTLVGAAERLQQQQGGAGGGEQLDEWVGTFNGYDGRGGWAQTVYCPSAAPTNGSMPRPCLMPRLYNIDEPNWYTEVKAFDSIVATSVPAGVFAVPAACAHA